MAQTHNEYMRKWREKHREEQRQWWREYRAKQLARNPNMDRDRYARYLERNPNHVKEHYERYKHDARKSKVRTRYRISAREYADRLAAQNGVCKLCGEPEKSVRNGKLLRLAVDHDHATGAVRGLLCNACNQLIEHVVIDASTPETEPWRQRAVAYLLEA